MRYRSRPQEVEAIQWTGTNNQEIIDAFDGKACIETRDRVEYFCTLLAGKDGAQEWVPVPVGHWLVHLPGDISDVWPVDGAYFQAKYEVAPLIDSRTFT
jgi:hypothetical protein